MNELMMTMGLANYSNNSVSAGPLQGGMPGGYFCCVSSEAKYSVFDVANWFLTHEAMTHKKLQKLCYYAQDWFYALKNQRFMNTEFQAWIHGPASPVLYACFKSFGFEKIKIKGTPKFSFSAEDTAFLNEVWETYGGKPAMPWRPCRTTNCFGRKRAVGTANLSVVLWRFNRHL